MKTLFKRILPLIMVLTLLFAVMAVDVSADQSVTVRISSKKPEVGETLSVYIDYPAEMEFNGVSGKLSYDPAILKLIDTEYTENKGNEVSFVHDTNSKTVIEFVVLKDGASSVKLTEAYYSDSVSNKPFTVPVGPINFTTKNANLNNGEQDLNNNTRAALTSITVPAGQLTPAFSSDVTEYKVIVPYSQTNGTLSCESLDPYADIKVEGDRILKVGNTTRVIVVTASNGETRRYTVVFNRLDEYGNDTTITDMGISVKVDGKDYSIGSGSAESLPSGFFISSVDYKGTAVPAYKDASGKIVLVYLIDSESNGAFFIYEDGNFYNFNYISCAGKTYFIKDVTEAAPEGFYKTNYELNGKSIACYKYNDKSYVDFVIFSAISPDGNAGYYSFDEAENTMQRLIKFTYAQNKSEEPVKTKNSVNGSTKTVVVSLIVIFCILLVVLIITLAIRAAKKSGKNVKGLFDSEE